MKSGIMTAAIGALALSATALAITPDERERAQACATRAISYLASQQDQATGGWAIPDSADRPHLPAIAALAITGIVMDANVAQDDRVVRRGVEYLLSFRKPDGGIHDGILPSYNTSISLAALAKVRGDEEATRAIPAAVTFLKGLQWSEQASDAPGTGNVPKSHPFYGGIGYGGHSRPDNSNLGFMLEGLHEAGVPADDPAFQRALVFLQRTQMLDEVNDMPYADGSNQGGFIYATGPDGQHAGAGESKAGMIDESLPDGSNVSRLRAYGSMTYLGFKSYLYADLDKNDPRVKAALGWITENYTLEENPGLGLNGYYYYLVTFAKALHAAGIDRLDVRLAGDLPTDQPAAWFNPDDPQWMNVYVTAIAPRGDGTFDASATPLLKGQPAPAGDAAPSSPNAVYDPATRTLTVRDARDWRGDLIAKLSSMQNDDGSFKSVDDRWMEDNPVLITSYALIALQHALRD